MIRVEPKGSIHIQLTWPESFGDIDLHYVGPGGTFYDGGFTGNDSDCFYANCDPGSLNARCPLVPIPIESWLKTYFTGKGEISLIFAARLL